MIIGIDGNEANVKYKVGVSVYTFELLWYFYKNAPADVQFVIYLRQPPRPDMPPANNSFTYRVVWGPILWSQVFLPVALFLGAKPDVFLAPAHYAPRFCPCPTVVTIHDLSYFYHPQEFLKKDLHKLTNWTSYSLRHAAKIIAVSKNTKKDIVKFYDIHTDKINVIYNGYIEKKKNEHEHNAIRAANIESIIKTRYFLYVGTIQPRKNIEKLIGAFDTFAKKAPDYKLIIAGKKGWLFEKIYARAERMVKAEKVIFAGYLLESDLSMLYEHAHAFVLPSLYEGFGIPILEAMSAGCPVLCSNTSSLPEVGGDACLYFNPHDTMDIVNKMTQIVEDKTLRDDLVIKGKERVKLFSWKKCGEETLRVLQSTIASS